jgi:membrane protease YdiL (CAAX protease family)
VLSVYVITRVALTLLLSGSPLIAWELKNLGWTYLGGSAGVFTVVAILLATRRSLMDYGFTLTRWRSGLDLGMTCYLILLIPYAIMVALLLYAGVTYSQPLGSAIIATAETLAIYLMLGVKVKENSNAGFNFVLLGALLLFPLLLGAWLGRLTIIVASTVVWQFLVSGFGEEIIYRGYYQSRINAEYGRPWRLMGVEFGPGLIIASLIFALSHALNPFRPLEGIYTLDWGWAFSSFFSGLFFGLLRERTGSLLASGIAHGLPDAVGEAANIILQLGLKTKG